MALTAKREAFAQEVANGKTQAEKFIDSYMESLSIEGAILCADTKSYATIGYYVYALSDPRSKRIFYIGKGKGDRLSHHSRSARLGHVDNAEKHKAIRSIPDAGMSVTETVIAVLNEENDAFRFERKIIKALRDSGLTNISNGIVTNTDRWSEEAKELIRSLAPIDWIKNSGKPEMRSAIENVFGSVENYNAFIRGNLQEIVSHAN